jgi:Rad52/22 family double-strand break repair protein
MALSQQARDVITRRLPAEKIKQRPGGGGMTFDYVTPDVVIDILNEAFEYQWDSRVFDSKREESTVIVGVELTVRSEDGTPVVKQQYGSCEITRGLGVGEAFKGAASDGLKKAATLFGVALELYQDDAPTTPSVPRKPSAPPAPRAPAKPTTPGAARPAPPKPVAPPTPPAPAAAAPRAPAPPVAPPAPPKQQDNPFDGDAPTTTASIPAPKPAAALPQAPRPVPAPPVARKADPFGGGTVGGISPTQLNALTNIASRKDLSQMELIALATVTDDEGNPKTSFDELENAEAIQVIRAAQQ